MTYSRYPDENEIWFDRKGEGHFRPMQSNAGIAIEHATTRPIANIDPHYTDSRWKTPRTVFLRSGYTLSPRGGIDWVREAGYDYSDRLVGTKFDDAWEAAKAAGKPLKTAAFFEHFLRVAFDDPKLKLVHVLAGINSSTLYSYRIFGYIRGEKAPVAAPAEEESCNTPS
jgi:hypothetical protein